MLFLLLAIVILFLSGFSAFVTRKHSQFASYVGLGGVVIASLLGLIPSLRVLFGAPELMIRLPWGLPIGSFFLGLDALSGFFATLIFVFSSITAFHAFERKTSGGDWFFLNLMILAMVLVVSAKNSILFLLAWEVMALASFVFVIADREQESARRAGLLYLIATHLGAAFLFVLFMVFWKMAGSFDLVAMPALGALSGPLFIFALIGFGTKAGLMPFHVWLPDSYAAAPCHISALMTGVMSKVGIYGLLRVLILLGAPSPWWGTVLMILGAVSAVTGILFALSQNDLKRLLAYSSVENIGIIFLGIGLGSLGVSLQSPVLVLTGFGGALFHILNHSLFKSLLFHGAGVVLRAVGTREINHMGGVLKKLPVTGIALLIAMVAIAGLPPLNGFVSEFLLYLGLFHGGILSQSGPSMAPCMLVLVCLVLVVGLATVCFSKLFGTAFLGELRVASASLEKFREADVSWTVRGPLLFLAFACILVSALAPLVLTQLLPLVHLIAGFRVDAVLGYALKPLWSIVLAIGVLTIFLVSLWFLRKKIFVGRNVVPDSVTWDCGYHKGSARIQYTGSSFSDPISEMFHPLLQAKRTLSAPSGFFPKTSVFQSETPDVCERRIYVPLFRVAESVFGRFRRFQHGRVQIYILYIFVVLVALLVWQVRQP